MKEGFSTALNVVLPVCIMMLCGTGLKRSGLLKPEFISAANKLVFRLFLPVSLFRNCYTGDLRDAGYGRMILFCCLCILLMFLLYIPAAKKSSPRDEERSVILQASFRGNLAMFGVPVLSLLYDGENLGVMAILLAFIIPELNILAVLCFEIFSGKKAHLRQLLSHIARNPLILAILAGIACNLLHIRLPVFLNKSLESLSAAATPLSFVLLGASFRIASARSNRSALTVALFGKLLLFPLIAISFGVLLGFRGPALASAVTLFGAPVAVSSVPMAEELGGDTALASEAVVLSTILSVFSIFGWILLMSYLRLL